MKLKIFICFYLRCKYCFKSIFANQKKRNCLYEPTEEQKCPLKNEHKRKYKKWTAMIKSYDMNLVGE